MFSPCGALKDMLLFPPSQRRYMLTQTRYFIINLTFIEWLMPCEDKAGSQSPVLNPGWRNCAKGTLTSYSLGEDGSKLLGAEGHLGFSRVGMLLSHCEHSLAFMYFGRTKRLGKPAKIWTCFWEPVSRSTVVNLRETEKQWWIRERGPTNGCVEAFIYSSRSRVRWQGSQSLSLVLPSQVWVGAWGGHEIVWKKKTRLRGIVHC